MKLTTDEIIAISFFFSVLFLSCSCYICCKVREIIKINKSEKYANKKYSDNSFLNNTNYVNAP